MSRRTDGTRRALPGVRRIIASLPWPPPWRRPPGSRSRRTAPPRRHAHAGHDHHPGHDAREGRRRHLDVRRRRRQVRRGLGRASSPSPRGRARSSSTATTGDLPLHDQRRPSAQHEDPARQPPELAGDQGVAEGRPRAREPQDHLVRQQPRTARPAKKGTYLFRVRTKHGADVDRSRTKGDDRSVNVLPGQVPGPRRSTATATARRRARRPRPPGPGHPRRLRQAARRRARRPGPVQRLPGGRRRLLPRHRRQGDGP